jgi:hypothetical protein
MRSRITAHRLEKAWGRALAIELAELFQKYPHLSLLSFQLSFLACLQRARRLAHQSLKGNPTIILQDLPLAFRIFLAELEADEVSHD